MPALQLTADEHLSRRIDAVNLKHRLGDVETDCSDRLHAWLPITATAPAAITSMALRRCGSRQSIRSRRALPCDVPRHLVIPAVLPCAGPLHNWQDVPAGVGER